jgi:hypothetical protein
MKWSIAILLCFSVALAQNQPDAARSRYRQQGAEALTKEQARSKANLCTDAEKGGNAAPRHWAVIVISASAAAI